MGKGDPNKPRGKMSSYAFFVQTCREEHKKKHPDSSVNFAEFSKKCSERWKVSARVLTRAGGRDFELASAADWPQCVYSESEAQDFGVPVYFKTTEANVALKRTLPFRGWMSVYSVAFSLLLSCPQTMSAKEKSKFEDMAKSDKARYDREMKNYVPPKGDKKGKKKDPNAPKRPP